MSFFIADAYADAGVPSAGPSMWGQLIMLGIFAVVFYFLLLRPQMKRQKEQKVLMESLQKGDEVVFAGGLIGTIRKVEDDFAVIELTTNVEVKVQRACVVATLPKGTLKNI
ncbi:MAG: preprotein translocase subunit YajC [bacterium]|jgi:preprotein translocase subunit YajC|nr:preprotein translocase subunit YajC [bacterium]